MDSIQSSEEIHPTIRCSRNLRRRTGFWMGLTVWEFVVCCMLSMIPTFLQGFGVIEHSSFLGGLLLSAVGLIILIIFKRNKQPNYFTLWIHYHFIHPQEWRSPVKPQKEFPIFDPQ